MGTRFLLNTGLLLLLAALITIAIFEPGTDKPEKLAPVTSTPRDDIDTIQIERRGQPEVTLKKEQGSWFLAGKPGSPAIPAAEFKVSTLLDLAGQTPEREYAASSLSPDRIGLQEPAVTIRYNSNDAIAFGTTDALNGNRYVRSGDRVLLIPDNAFSIINTDRAGYISTRLFEERSKITGLRLPRYALTKTDDEKWKLDPENPDIDADTLTRLIDDWKHTSALWVEHSDVETARGERIEIVLDGQTIELFAEKTDTDLRIVRPDYGVVYHLTDNNVERLLPDLMAASTARNNGGPEQHSKTE